MHEVEVNAPGPQTATLALRPCGQKQGKGEREGQMKSGWAAKCRKAHWGAREVCRTPVGPANSPTRDLVLQNVHGTGHPGHPDCVLYVLHVLAQVRAPDGDTGASVHRPGQWLHLFQDTDLEHFHLPVTPGQPGDAD